MGNILKKMMCPIYPEPDSDDDSFDENRPIKPQVMYREYKDESQIYEVVNKIIKPSEIISMSNKNNT